MTNEAANNKDSDNLNLYEVGYLLAPTISEDKVAEAVANIKSLLDQNKTVSVSEEFPKLKLLTYTMTKTVGATKHKFDRGYFGWVKFEAENSAIDNIRIGLAGNNDIFRFIIVRTVRDIAPTFIRSRVKISDAVPVSKDEVRKQSSSQVPTSIEEIDKSIEELVID